MKKSSQSCFKKAVLVALEQLENRLDGAQKVLSGEKNINRRSFMSLGGLKPKDNE